MQIDFKELNSKDIYKLISSTVIPRPIAWVSTYNENGLLNLAPFSYFIPIGGEYLILAIGHKSDGSLKDTIRNIKLTKKATINFVTNELFEEMKLSANELSMDQSEAKTYNIDTKSIDINYPSIVSDTQCALFCEFEKIIDMPTETIPVVLKVTKLYCQDNHIDKNLNIHLDNIARLGSKYATLEKI